jgi:DNA ligase-1
VILEVAFNNVMRSERHASGFALRFPRILRIRTDKPLDEIDTVARVEEVYQSQVDKPVEATQSTDAEKTDKDGEE